MKQITTNFAVDSNMFGYWLEMNGGELVGCDRNSRKGEFMFIVRTGAIEIKEIGEKIWQFRLW